MKIVLGLVVMVLTLVPLLGFLKPAHATMPESDASIIVEASYQAVQDSLDALQTANDSGDIQQIGQALQALNLSIKNHAVASENLARLNAGEALNDSVLTTCYLIADNLSLFSSQLTANQLEGAQSSLTEAQRLEAFLPPAANPGLIMAGLGDLSSRIITLSSEAVSLLRSAGVTGGEEKVQGGEGKLGINTHVGSPI